MASSGNTWFKKLRNKQRLHSLKVKGVKSRFAVDSPKVDSEKVNACDRPSIGFHRHRKTYGSVASPRRAARKAFFDGIGA
jgi:hypothetical protein